MEDGNIIACVIIGVPLWYVSACIGRAIGSEKNSPEAGFMLGLLLGPLGWIIAFFVDNRPKCPSCFGRIDSKATVCPHCHRGNGSFPLQYAQSLPDVALAAPPPNQSAMLECPYCFGEVNPKATVCRHCQREIAFVQMADGTITMFKAEDAFYAQQEQDKLRGPRLGI
jgi:predicted amidophosphoribosyltransferase